MRGRTPERVLEALVCRSLVALGKSQVDAAATVISWSDWPRDPARHADENRAIWREARVPPVAR